MSEAGGLRCAPRMSCLRVSSPNCRLILLIDGVLMGAKADEQARPLREPVTKRRGLVRAVRAEHQMDVELGGDTPIILLRDLPKRQIGTGAPLRTFARKPYVVDSAPARSYPRSGPANQLKRVVGTRSLRTT